MPRLVHASPPLVLVAALLLWLPAVVMGDSPEDAAAEFLEAWVFRDHAAMWTLLDAPSRAEFGEEAVVTAESPPEAFVTALESVPLLIERYEIVSSQPEGTGLRVRCRLEGVHPTSGEPVTLPTTLWVNEGPRVGFHVPVVAAPRMQLPTGHDVVRSLSDTARQVLPGGLPPTQVIDGVTVEDILASSTAVNAQIQSLRMGMNIQASMMGQGFNSRGVLLYQAPGRIRFLGDQFLFVSDGLASWLYFPAANAHMRLPMMGGSDLLSFLPGGGGDVINASLVGRDDVRGRSGWHLVVAPGARGALGLSDLAGQIGSMDVWLDTETLLPQRTQVRSMGIMVTLDFDSVEVNPGGISDELFIFSPPPGSMELPTSIPTLPGFGGR